MVLSSWRVTLPNASIAPAVAAEALPEIVELMILTAIASAAAAGRDRHGKGAVRRSA